MFIGIWGKENGLSTGKIIDLCHSFAKDFEQEFNVCYVENFVLKDFADNSPHLCEGSSNKAVKFTAQYLKDKANFL